MLFVVVLQVQLSVEVLARRSGLVLGSENREAVDDFWWKRLTVSCTGLAISMAKAVLFRLFRSALSKCEASPVHLVLSPHDVGLGPIGTSIGPVGRVMSSRTSARHRLTLTAHSLVVVGHLEEDQEDQTNIRLSAKSHGVS